MLIDFVDPALEYFFCLFFQPEDLLREEERGVQLLFRLEFGAHGVIR